MFVKVFPKRFAATGLLNELVVYLVAKHGSLPVARRGYILVLPAEQILRVHPDYRHEIPIENGLTIAWATTAIEGPPLRLLHSIREPEMQRRLRKWRQLPDVLAFDELVVNQDRTDDNLIVVRNGEFAIVDHGEIAGGMRLDGFDIGLSGRNALADELFGAQIPRNVKSAMMLAAESHASIVDSASSEISQWVELLSSGLESDANKIVPFLKHRARQSPARVRAQQGLLL